jgi:hypothetical protein
MVSSRKAENVNQTVEELQSEGLGQVRGMVCHVGKDEDRKALVQVACLVPAALPGDRWESSRSAGLSCPPSSREL